MSIEADASGADDGGGGAQTDGQLFETGALRRHGERRRRLAVDVPRRR